MLEASIKIPKKFCFISKQACIYCIRSEDKLQGVTKHRFVCFLLPQKPILCISNSPLGCLHSDVSIEYIVTAQVSLTESVFM